MHAAPSPKGYSNNSQRGSQFHRSNTLSSNKFMSQESMGQGEQSNLNQSSEMMGGIGGESNIYDSMVQDGPNSYQSNQNSYSQFNSNSSNNPLININTPRAMHIPEQRILNPSTQDTILFRKQRQSTCSGKRKKRSLVSIYDNKFNVPNDIEMSSSGYLHQSDAQFSRNPKITTQANEVYSRNAPEGDLGLYNLRDVDLQPQNQQQIQSSRVGRQPNRRKTENMKVKSVYNYLEQQKKKGTLKESDHLYDEVEAVYEPQDLKVVSDPNFNPNNDVTVIDIKEDHSYAPVRYPKQSNPRVKKKKKKKRRKISSLRRSMGEDEGSLCGMVGDSGCKGDSDSSGCLLI